MKGLTFFSFKNERQLKNFKKTPKTKKPTTNPPPPNQNKTQNKKAGVFFPLLRIIASDGWTCGFYLQLQIIRSSHSSFSHCHNRRKAGSLRFFFFIMVESYLGQGLPINCFSVSAVFNYCFHKNFRKLVFKI